jgi:spermidine synthase
VHGVQRVSAMQGCEPTTYYHPTGPAGRFLRALPPASAPRRIALVGLGSGALACYARDGERWDLFELDPVVARVASDSSYFTFLTHSKATRGPIILGDARLALARAGDVRYNVIIVDAFSSDAIPIHLITREAIELYARRLTSDGVLLFHVSNRFFRLRPVLAAVAPVVGFAAYGDADLDLTVEQSEEIKYASDWVLLARTPEAASRDSRWQPLERATLRVWTDDYSNPLGSMGLDIQTSRRK